MPAAHDAVAILGGAFDPPHAGHLHLVRAALADFPIDEIRVVPNGDPRHRGVCAPWNERLAMCEMAFAGIDRVKVRRDEAPGRPRFSIDTLRAMKDENPGGALIFIVGADAFAELESWREWPALFSLAHFAVAPRDESPPLPPALAAFCANRFCENPSMLSRGSGKVLKWKVSAPSVSATALRRRLAGAGKGGVGGVGGGEFISREVLEYACERALYAC